MSSVFLLTSYAANINTNICTHFAQTTVNLHNCRNFAPIARIIARAYVLFLPTRN